ncbi:TetR/AcrR family transcriptional regulator [Nocardiopsis coralliicola]
MAGSWREFGPDRLPPPLSAALACFAEHGFHGTSIRSVAERAGLSVAGLYHHYPSKQYLLEALVTAVMEELLEHTGRALAEAGPSADKRFDHVVECLLRFHMHRRDHAFICSSELRSMRPQMRQACVALRDRQQRMLDGVVADGVRDGAFTTPHPHDASRAVTTMCVSVAQWYRPDGPLGPDTLAARYLALARATVGAAPAC